MDIESYRRLPPEEKVVLWKALMQSTVPRGEVKEAAAAAGCADFILYKLRNEELIESYFPVHPAVPLVIHHTGRFDLLDFLERLFGRVAFRLPRANMTARELGREIARTIKTFGELLQASTEALEEDSPGGDKISAEEYRLIVNSADAAIARIAAIKEAVRPARGRGEFPVRFGGGKGEA